MKQGMGKTMNHGSAGKMPGKGTKGAPHKSMGAECPKQDHTRMHATSPSAGKPVSFEGKGIKANKAPKIRTASFGK